MVIRTNDAPAKMKFKAPKSVQPEPPNGQPDRGGVGAVAGRARGAAAERRGLNLRRAKEDRPLPLVKWSLGVFIQLMLAHERRHIWQAREVRQNPAFPV